jgi:DNA (cytosine-5)-methyltransferase 1
MTFVSLFTGIGGVEVAWTKLGWECLAVAETDKAACAVLRHHFPDVPNLGDVTKIIEQQIIDLGHIDALFAGWPCQDVSVAGQRKGFKKAIIPCEHLTAQARMKLKNE